jgi:hypothetical protein
MYTGMSEITMIALDEILKWFFTIISASFAAYFGSLFALGKTKKEKLWLQKREAYLSIIESLHNIIIWADEEYSSNFPFPLPTVEKDKLDELRRNQQTSLDILRKHVHLGGLVVSRNASSKLEELLSEYFSEEFRFFDDIPHHEHEAAEMISNHYLNIRKIVENHIEQVKVIAQNDLY